MKKFFLAAAIVSFCSVAAQENNFFNAEEYLKKKKVSPLPNDPITQKQKETFVLPLVSPQAKYSYTLANGSKVYLLPQDNMPCVVPNRAEHDVMPNLSDFKSIYVFPKEMQIPNPGWRIKPLIPEQK
jgi:hypothetical protein